MSTRWTNGLFVLLLLVQLLLVSSHAPARGSRMERFLLAAAAPFVHGSSALTGSIRGLFTAVKANGELRRETEQLAQQLAQAERELVRLEGVEEEMRRLSRIAAYTGRESETYVADVVYADRGAAQRTLVLYAGNRTPQPDQVVRTPDGLVGRVILAAGRYAKVQPITDRASSVSAMVERTRRKGIVRGAGEGVLELELIPLDADVATGDRIVTAGIDGVYPRGMPIGTVAAVTRTSGLFLHITLTPTIDLGRIDQVYVLTTEPVPQRLMEANGGLP